MKAEPTTLTIEGEILNEQKTINIYYEIKIIAFSYYLIHIINYTKKKINNTAFPHSLVWIKIIDSNY